MSKYNEEEFFDQPIYLQLPDMPNSTISSAIAPGQGWAPSLPMLSKLEFSQKQFKDLMLRTKTGLKVGDNHKEAHLLFYLGIMAENKKQYLKVYLIST